jgi:ketosteroid isomerase-like protein
MTALMYLSVLALLGCAVIPTGYARINPALQNIAKINQMAKDAAESHDLQAYLNMYSEDVLMLPNGYPGFVGKYALEKSFSWIPYVGTVEYDIKYLDYSNPANGRALEIKEFVIKNKRGQVMFMGKALQIWSLDRSTGDWKIILEMYNNS